MFRAIIFSLIFLNFGISDTFYTPIGECTLEIYGGRVEDIPDIVHLVKKESKKLIHEYNNCLEEIRIFRDLHLEFAGIYIHKQSQIKNPFGGGSTITGTGGTPFMKYLKKHRDETEKQKI